MVFFVGARFGLEKDLAMQSYISFLCGGMCDLHRVQNAVRRTCLYYEGGASNLLMTLCFTKLTEALDLRA